MIRIWIPVLAFLFLVVGCSRYSPVLYEWPAYNAVIFDKVSEPEDFDEAAKVQHLIAEYKDVEESKIPPGINIYIGYVLAMQGKTSEAKKYFQKEAELFPESKTWVDNLLKSNAFKDVAVKNAQGNAS